LRGDSTEPNPTQEKPKRKNPLRRWSFGRRKKNIETRAKTFPNTDSTRKRAITFADQVPLKKEVTWAEDAPKNGDN
jgi:hypothetical protein